MAEAFFNQRAPELGVDATAESGGTLVAGVVNANIVRTMGEVGIDLEGQKPKAVTDEMVAKASRVISLGGVSGDRTAVKFGIAEDWNLPDPAGLTWGELRQVRSAVAERVDDLLLRLKAEESAG